MFLGGRNISYSYFLYFIIYSFLGWVSETTYCAIVDKKYVNRGFLNGPFCPIYGVGALIVITVLTRFQDNIIFLFLGGMIFTSILEYITSILLEVFFNLKWWDYTNYKFNIQGRVCLLNSILFGVLSVITVNFINPIVRRLITSIPSSYSALICVILITWFLGDAIITVYKVLQLGGKLQEMNLLYQELKEKSEIYRDIVQHNINKLDGLIERENEKIIHVKDQINKLKMKWEDVMLKNKTNSKRIIKAFPNIRSLKYNASLDRLKEEIRNIKKNKL